MKRRDFLQRIAAVPVAAAVALPAIADDGVALYSTAHPTGFTCVNGHPWCNLCVSDPFSEEALEEMWEKLSPDSLEEVELEMPEHEWNEYARCIHCGALARAVEEGTTIQWCQKRPFTQTLVPW